MPCRIRPFTLLVAVAALLVVAAAAAGAAATRHHTATVRAAKNAKLGDTIVVDAHGRTLYALSSETSRHLLCTPKVCVGNWPPLTVRSRRSLKAGSGVHGHLSVVRRPDGRLQVTLRGMPLYRFAGDSRKGQANGQGQKAFGGTWRAVTAKGPAPSGSSPDTTSSTSTTTPTPTTPSSPPPSPSPYPGY